MEAASSETWEQSEKFVLATSLNDAELDDYIYGWLGYSHSRLAARDCLDPSCTFHWVPS